MNTTSEPKPTEASEPRGIPARLHLPMVVYLTGLVAAASAPSVVTVVADLAPPVQILSEKQVTLFSLIVTLACYLVTARFCMQLDNNEMRKCLNRVTALLLAAVVVYTGLWYSLVIELPDKDHRVVMGFAYTPTVNDIRIEFPDITDAELIRDFYGRQYWLVYTESSRAWANWILLLGWLSFFGILSAFISVSCTPVVTNAPVSRDQICGSE